MAAALVLLAGALLPGWGSAPQCRAKVKINGAECSHHSECRSDCCLVDLDTGNTFCAPKAKVAMACLLQTKGATNVICPCQRGLGCTSKNRSCSRQCHII
ncbi:colipase-like protein 2 [Choloepus didactylus]|uniref:colipase-like protein 2 n=1 Tax=Choloepus didactylus TaxID=27675 RepID=UPI00189FC643|nr:colipase-like protein 2 [Choloepus didactylus]